MAATMYVIEVIPLTRGIQIDTLTYYSRTPYDLGTILTVPVRSSEVRSVVTGVHEVSSTKAALRAATFSLKKLPHQPDADTLSPTLLTTARELSEYYAAPLGATLYSLLSSEIRSGDIPLPHTHHAATGETHTPEVLQATLSDRYIAYRSIVRSTFARSGSLLCVCPTAAEAYAVADKLSQGIEERVVMLTSAQSKKQIKAAYAALEDFTKPKLIIAAPSYALIERHDITTVIVDRERSPHFRARTRPYLDYRHALIVHARHTGRRIILGDLLVRTETESLRREERYLTLDATPKRIELPGTLSVVKMQETDRPGTPFALFSDELIDAVKDTRKRKGRAVLFAARRGLAPVVSCIDCRHIFRSEVSGAPYSLVRIKKNGEERRLFVCPVSGERKRAADTCPLCGSWRLRERGIGIQHVYDEFTTVFPKIPVILFDHTTANTYKKACFLRDRFYSKKGAILLCTQMALPYLTEPVTMSAIVNMDALRATPTWRLTEDNLHTILSLRELSTKDVLVQTRQEPDDLLAWARQGSVEQFYTDEIELRKTFNYPPFTVFIHCAWHGSQQTVAATEETVRTVLGDESATFYSAPPTPKGTRIRYALMRISARDWPKTSLVARLRSLPPHVRVMINPDRII